MATTGKEAFLRYLFIYKDRYPLPTLTNENVMQELEHMEVREDDIFIVTYPRSGTHWMKEIVNLILVNGHAEKLTAKDRRLVIELADHVSLDTKFVEVVGPVLQEMKDAPSPRVMSTHVPYPLLPKQLRERRTKLIYVYRNPKDVIVSYYKFMVNLLKLDTNQAKFEDFFDLLVLEQYQYGRWFEHVMEYYKHKDDKNFLALPFESMKQVEAFISKKSKQLKFNVERLKNPFFHGTILVNDLLKGPVRQDLHKVVRDVASFLGQSLDDAALQRVVEGASFETMKKSYQRDHEKIVAEGKEAIQANLFLRQGTIDQWKDIFTQEQNERFDQVFRETMKDCEWTRSYVPDSVIEWVL